MSAKKEKLPWYKREPAKFFAGTVGLSWEVKAIYGLVLDLIFDARGKLPNDADRIVNYLGTGMTKQRWSRVLQELVEREKLRIIDGFVTNDKMTRDIARAEKSPGDAPAVALSSLKTGQETLPKTGQEKTDLFDATANKDKGIALPEGSRNGEKDPNISPVPARARETQTQTKTKTSTADVVLQVEEIAKALNQSRGRYWEHDYRRLIDEGLEYGDILEAARAHRGPPIKGLNGIAGLARAKQGARLAGRRTSTPAPEADRPVDTSAMTDKDWERHLALFLRLGSWDAAKHGPPPTRQGHLVPPGPYGRWLNLWRINGEHPAEEVDTGGNIVPFPSTRPSEFMRAMWQPIEGEAVQ